MDKLSIANFDYLIEQTQESLERVIQIRVSIAKNTIQIHTLFERMRVTVIQAGRNDPKFLDIITNTQVNELADPSMESIFQEINELITTFNQEV